MTPREVDALAERWQIARRDADARAAIVAFTVSQMFGGKAEFSAFMIHAARQETDGGEEMGKDEMLATMRRMARASRGELSE